MSQQYPNNWKFCATCAFWSGDRESDNYGLKVYVDGPNVKAKCQNRSCVWNNNLVQAGMTCAGFKKWNVLK